VVDGHGRSRVRRAEVSAAASNGRCRTQRLPPGRKAPSGHRGRGETGGARPARRREREWCSRGHQQAWFGVDRTDDLVWREDAWVAEGGSLRTYLGTAPGVGKTFAMLAKAGAGPRTASVWWSAGSIRMAAWRPAAS